MLRICKCKTEWRLTEKPLSKRQNGASQRSLLVKDRMAPHREASKYKTEWRLIEKPLSKRQNVAKQRSL